MRKIRASTIRTSIFTFILSKINPLMIISIIISIEDSKQYIHGALGVLGDDYIKMVDNAYNHQWI
jgi:hypothetical protein